jgi:hypothetical protein
MMDPTNVLLSLIKWFLTMTLSHHIFLRYNRQGSSSFQGPQEGNLQEGDPYPHQGSLLQAKNFEIEPQAQV